MNARESDMADLAAQDRAARAYSRQLYRHPDPRDPEWPGHAREAHVEDVIEKAKEQAAVARDYLVRAISASDRKDPHALHRLLGAADEELQAAFEILQEVM